MKKNTEYLRKQYAIMKGKGMLQRDIAKRLGVSEKTICDWRKSLPISHYLIVRDGLIKRLKHLVADLSTNGTEINNLVNNVTSIERIIKAYETPNTVT
jgi:transcriptional regulator with XRE-family HTH domain